MRVLGSLGLLTLVAPALLLGVAPITEAGDRVGFVLVSDSHRTHYRDHGGHHGSRHRSGLSVFLDLGHLRIFGGHRRPHREARLHRGHRGHRGHREGHHIERGHLAHKRNHLMHRAERELSAVGRERSGLAREEGIYTELSQAFGKGGVQALLIDAAIPRLEDEANLLLRRMTDGRMSLKLETQRQRRGAGSARGGGTEPIETLDIFISDELGTRSYELFSGGEGFRINFALRIALSKLLAWRAGAPLSTLFIDEGFGTQDAVGRERILDVISAISNDFEKVLVVTHLDDLKEAFPVRIEVQKDESGSTFWLS